MRRGLGLDLHAAYLLLLVPKRVLSCLCCLLYGDDGGGDCNQVNEIVVVFSQLLVPNVTPYFAWLVVSLRSGPRPGLDVSTIESWALFCFNLL